MTTILAFDTSAAHCAAALLRDGQSVTRVETMARGQGERLMGLLEELLEDNQTRWADLDAIGVCIGPGNFTGIRISVSAARGLALGLGIPAVGVSMFDTTARLARRAKTQIPAPQGKVYVFDADTITDPIMTSSDEEALIATSTDYPAADHIAWVAKLAAERFGPDTPRPAPLYVKPPDAAPSRDAPPVILP